LQAANAVIRHNRDRKPKNLRTQNEVGEKIYFASFETDNLEARNVAKEIKRLVTQENFSYNDIALLYRTNAQSRLFEDRFTNEEIPYHIIGGLKFYDRKEIKDILAYLHVIANPLDDLHLLRIINTPKRGLGLTNLNRLREFASSQELSILELIVNRNLLAKIELSQRFRAGILEFAAMIMSFIESAKNLPVDELIMTVLNESGYMKMLRESVEEGKAENISREENLGTFVDSAKEFLEKNPEGNLQDFLNHVALITDLDTLDEEESCVKLMTVHAAKGLEFPVVFIVGMEDGVFPHFSSFVDEAEIEEERRACYVAITRAKKKLYITAADTRMSFGKIRKQEVSRFVEEIPDSCLARFGATPVTIPQKESPTSGYKAPTANRPAQIKPVEKKVAPSLNLQIGDVINHKKWGLGTVMMLEGDKVKISFKNPEYGLKTLALKVAPINKV
jgi:DNA helicase-2/ATP-dependent DNA helicase PcrA